VTKSGTNAGGTWSWSYNTTDGPAQSQTVTITANDGNGGISTTTFALTVNNVAPTATFNAPTSVGNSSTFTLSLTSPSDPSSVDTAAGFTYAFDGGSGYGSFSSSNSASFTAPVSVGSFTVKGKIRDKDGGVTEYTQSVAVNAGTTTSISAPSITYNAHGMVTVTVSSSGGTPTGDVSLTVDSGTPLTHALSSGSWTFDVGILNAGDHSLSTTYAAQGSFGGSSATGTLHVNQRTLTITATNQSKTYGDTFTPNGATQFTTGAGQLVNGDSVGSVTLTSSGYVNTATYTAPGPDYAITPSAATGGSGLGNYSIGYVAGTLHVNQRTLTVTATNQSKTYGDTFTPDGTTQFSTGAGQLVNGDSVASVTLTSSGYAAGAIVAGSPYAIVVSSAVGTGLSNYNITYVNGKLTVTPRAALTAYIGQQTFVTSGSSSTTAQVTLTASIQDPTGSGFGSVAAATVTFTDILTGNVLASNVPVSLVNGTDTSIGTANTIVTLSTGQYGAQSYQIRVTLGGSYNNDGQPVAAKTATVTVMQPAVTNSMRGAGTIPYLSASAGTYKPPSGQGVTYSFSLKYNNGGSNPQGQIQIIIPQSDGSTIYIKSNSITSVAIDATTKTATAYTKASIYRVLANGQTVSIQGNVSLRMDVKDGGMTNGVPNPDEIGFTVISSQNSELFYSNNWVYDAVTVAWRTVRQQVTTQGGLAVVIM
jgi:hypothetical protein